MRHMECLLPKSPPVVSQAGVAERSIREAMRKGAFDNLGGKGKPLKLDDDHTSQARVIPQKESPPPAPSALSPLSACVL